MFHIICESEAISSEDYLTDMKCAMIHGNYDVVPKGGDVSKHVPNLENISFDCGHWIQQEKTAEVNAFLVDWLKRNAPS